MTVVFRDCALPTAGERLATGHSWYLSRVAAPAWSRKLARSTSHTETWQIPDPARSTSQTVHSRPKFAHRPFLLLPTVSHCPISARKFSFSKTVGESMTTFNNKTV